MFLKAWTVDTLTISGEGSSHKVNVRFVKKNCLIALLKDYFEFYSCRHKVFDQEQIQGSHPLSPGTIEP
jgi:hypothetical protein